MSATATQTLTAPEVAAMHGELQARYTAMTDPLDLPFDGTTPRSRAAYELRRNQLRDQLKRIGDGWSAVDSAQIRVSSIAEEERFLRSEWRPFLEEVRDTLQQELADAVPSNHRDEMARQQGLAYSLRAVESGLQRPFGDVDPNVPFSLKGTRLAQLMTEAGFEATDDGPREYGGFPWHGSLREVDAALNADGPGSLKRRRSEAESWLGAVTSSFMRVWEEVSAEAGMKPRL